MTTLESYRYEENFENYYDEKEFEGGGTKIKNVWMGVKIHSLTCVNFEQFFPSLTMLITMLHSDYFF